MNRSFANARIHQQGAALAVVLILLLVMTLVGVFVLRSTLMEERMSSSALDRSVAFQSAESALREAEALIAAASAGGVSIGYDCDLPTRFCPAMPTNAYDGASPPGCATGTLNCWANAASRSTSVAGGSDVSAGAPQYYIEYMGQRTSVDELGLGDSANLNQYGGGGGVPTAAFYRVTARSADPTAAGSEGRAIVVLQTTVVAD